MSSCKSASTPVDIKYKLSATSGKLVADPSSNHLYKPFVGSLLVGALQDLTITHLDISYALQQICLFMHDLG